MRSNAWQSGRNESAVSSWRRSQHARDADEVRDEIRVREHHALRLAGRAGRVDDRREIARAARSWRGRETRARRPTRRACGDARAPRRRRGVRIVTRLTSRDVGGPASITTIVAKRGQRRPRLAATFASCVGVETTASVASLSRRMNADLLGRERRIHRHRDRAGRENREVERTATRAGSPTSSATRSPRAMPSAPSPRPRSRTRSTNSRAADQHDAVVLAAAEQIRLSETGRSRRTAARASVGGTRSTRRVRSSVPRPCPRR